MSSLLRIYAGNPPKSEAELDAIVDNFPPIASGRIAIPLYDGKWLWEADIILDAEEYYPVLSVEYETGIFIHQALDSIDFHYAIMKHGRKAYIDGRFR